MEWQFARRLVRQIIPYKLDATPVPPALKGLVHIDRSDENRAHAELLRAILGVDWSPEGSSPFPGQWIARLSLMGMGEAEYNLEFRVNGQILGEGHIVNSGLLAGMMTDIGAGNVLDMRIPVNGAWQFKKRERILELDITAEMMGQVNRDVVQIHTSGEEQGWLQGTSMGGLPWQLHRS
jgi:hypothetical protein